MISLGTSNKIGLVLILPKVPQATYYNFQLVITLQYKLAIFVKFNKGNSAGPLKYSLVWLNENSNTLQIPQEKDENWEMGFDKGFSQTWDES